jgi:hypothetical protein
MRKINVVNEGSPEYSLFMNDDNFSPTIVIGEFQSQHVNGGCAMGNQDELVWVRGYIQGMPLLSETVPGFDTYERNTRNKMGELGAFRPTAPSQEKIDAAVKRVRNRMLRKMGK